MNQSNQNCIFVIDGPDGCGKTTQAKLLADYFAAKGRQTLQLRDPGTTNIGEQIRKILLDPANSAMSVTTEVMLYMAARTQLCHEVVVPALEAGKCVVLDRWLSSTCAYQGYAGGFGIENIIKIAEIVLPAAAVAFTVILDCDNSVAEKRLKPELDRMELKGRLFHENVRKGFLEFARTSPRAVIIDASADIESVHNQIVTAVERTLRI